MPQGRGVGVSARIENEIERERLRSAVQAGLEADESAGFIVRTAAEDAPHEALRADMIYLRKLWEFVRQKGLRTSPGQLVHAELPLHLRILRDLLRPDIERVLIDQPNAHREMCEFAATFIPEACRGSSCTPRSARSSSCTTWRRRSRRPSIARSR